MWVILSYVQSYQQLAGLYTEIGLLFNDAEPFCAPNTHTSVEGSPHLASHQSNYSSLKVNHKTLHSVICNSIIQTRS